jgi:uncharacterized membrane protein (DUF485 family)
MMGAPIAMTNDNPSQEPTTHPPASRIGLALFGVYVLLYGGFITLVLVRPDLLAARPFGGVNLAIAYGLGLIAAAVLLAVISIFAGTRGPRS